MLEKGWHAPRKQFKCTLTTACHLASHCCWHACACEGRLLQHVCWLNEDVFLHICDVRGGKALCPDATSHSIQQSFTEQVSVCVRTSVCN